MALDTQQVKVFASGFSPAYLIKLKDVIAGTYDTDNPIRITLESLIMSILDQTESSLFMDEAVPTTLPPANLNDITFGKFTYIAVENGTYTNFKAANLAATPLKIENELALLKSKWWDDGLGAKKLRWEKKTLLDLNNDNFSLKDAIGVINVISINPPFGELEPLSFVRWTTNKWVWKFKIMPSGANFTQDLQNGTKVLWGKNYYILEDNGIATKELNKHDLIDRNIGAVKATVINPPSTATKPYVKLYNNSEWRYYEDGITDGYVVLDVGTKVLSNKKYYILKENGIAQEYMEFLTDYIMSKIGTPMVQYINPSPQEIDTAKSYIIKYGNALYWIIRHPSLDENPSNETINLGAIPQGTKINCAGKHYIVGDNGTYTEDMGEASEDDKLYGRKNKKWVEVPVFDHLSFLKNHVGVVSARVISNDGHLPPSEMPSIYWDAAEIVGMPHWEYYPDGYDPSNKIVLEFDSIVKLITGTYTCEYYKLETNGQYTQITF
jgi:hypothetical protein